MAKLSLGNLQQLACMRIELMELADKIDPTRKKIPLDGCVRILSDAFYEGAGTIPPNECMSTDRLKEYIEKQKKWWEEEKQRTAEKVKTMTEEKHG